jgi:hypothetical protein
MGRPYSPGGAPAGTNAPVTVPGPDDSDRTGPPTIGLRAPSISVDRAPGRLRFDSLVIGLGDSIGVRN